MPKRYAEPIEGLLVGVGESEIRVHYEGAGDGLLIHQAHLADRVINTTVAKLSAPEPPDA